ncbi:MAG: TetR/AcrR family transcriptional regulator [Mycobacteriaceae bacterium]
MSRDKAQLIGLLPALIGAPAPEREDAAQNRRRLLEVATAMVNSAGVDAVTMDKLAEAAGVGKGTIFRRFGSKSGLMLALLDHTEKSLQEAFMFGPPPLGPDAAPLERLIAFGRARLDLVDVQGDVMRAAEHSPDSRYFGPVYTLNHQHLVLLMQQAGVTGDVDLLAFALLAPLEAGTVLHQIERLGISRARIANSWEDLVKRVLVSCSKQVDSDH